MSNVSSLPLLTAYRALARNLPDTIVLMYDGSLRVLLAEGRDLAVLGVAPALAAGSPMREVLPAALADRFTPYFRSALAGCYDAVEDDLGSDGSVYRVQFTPAHSDSGAIVAGMMICQNVTELRAAQHDLQSRLDELTTLHGRLCELEQLKTDMLRLGAHDLRNPLMVITNYAQYLADALSASDSEQPLEYVAEILGAAERMKIISRDILDAERIEHLLQTAVFDPINLVGTLKDAAEGLRANAALKRHVMTLCMPECDVHGRGDGPLLREAAGNLISNAIKYTPAGGRVDVMVHASAEEIVFSVADTGYGVPPEAQDRLFRPLTRAGSKEARREAGTGFGLYLVKRIVERHGGEVFFQRRMPRGSTFGFRLPAQSA